MSEENKDYWVWFDLACEDFMALEKPEMTPVLMETLKAEGVDVRQAMAPSAKEAIHKVFPRRAEGKVGPHTIVGLEPGSTPRQRRLH